MNLKKDTQMEQYTGTEIIIMVIVVTIVTAIKISFWISMFDKISNKGD